MDSEKEWKIAIKSFQETIKKAAEERGLMVTDLISSVTHNGDEILDEFICTAKGMITGEELFKILKEKYIKKFKAQKLIQEILLALFMEPL